MVELIGDDGVVGTENGFEETGIGIEARGVENRVVGSVERADGVLELLVQILGATDKTDRGHPETPLVEGLFGSSDDLGVISQTQDSCWRRS